MVSLDDFKLKENCNFRYMRKIMTKTVYYWYISIDFNVNLKNWKQIYFEIRLIKKYELINDWFLPDPII